MTVFKSLLRTPWFWGIIGIVLLLSLNVIKDPTYLAVGINPTTGQLSGTCMAMRWSMRDSSA